MKKSAYYEEMATYLDSAITDLQHISHLLTQLSLEEYEKEKDAFVYGGNTHNPVDSQFGTGVRDEDYNEYTTVHLSNADKRNGTIGGLPASWYNGR